MLALLHLLCSIHRGAEWFYAGFFNVNKDSHGRMPPSSQWCWQGMMPSYAQATFTQAAPLLYEGALVFADANTTYAVKTNAKNYTYLFQLMHTVRGPCLGSTNKLTGLVFS